MTAIASQSVGLRVKFGRSRLVVDRAQPQRDAVEDLRQRVGLDRDLGRFRG